MYYWTILNYTIGEIYEEDYSVDYKTIPDAVEAAYKVIKHKLKQNEVQPLAVLKIIVESGEGNVVWSSPRRNARYHASTKTTI